MRLAVAAAALGVLLAALLARESRIGRAAAPRPAETTPAASRDSERAGVANVAAAEAPGRASPPPFPARVLECIDFLAVPSADWETRRGVLEELRRLAVGHLHEAVDVLRSVDATWHRHAQLVLAQAPEARWTAEALRDAPDESVRTYASLRLDPPMDAETLDDPSLYARGTGNERLPVGAIRARMVEDVSDSKPEFQEDYRGEFVPLFDDLSRHIPAERRWWVDLDGDGERELFLDGTDLWRTGWFHDHRFLAAIGANGGLRAFERLEWWTTHVVVADPDGDGCAEVFCWLRAPAGRVVVAHASGFATLRGASQVRRGPLFAVRSLYTAAIAGTWGERMGTMAWNVELFRYERGAFVSVGSAYLPLEG